MHPTLQYIRKATDLYKTYRGWIGGTGGDTWARGLFTCTLRRDWEMAGALYRIERRKSIERRKRVWDQSKHN